MFEIKPYPMKSQYYKRKDKFMSQADKARREEFYTKVAATLENLMEMGNGRIEAKTERATITAYYVGGMIRVDIRPVKIAGENGEEP